MEWNEMEWNEMEWNEMEWNEMERNRWNEMMSLISASMYTLIVWMK